MKLLFITQKIDKNDDLLGFTHGWLLEFAKHCEKITVVALGAGEYDLPENVRILSLGKNSIDGGWRMANRIKYIFNFYKYIWCERKNYDAVLVHMNREYMLLGGIFWRLWDKKAALWYNHKKGNILSVLAGCLAKAIFYTSPFSFFAKWPKAKMMPAGVDADRFKARAAANKEKNSILFLGRISPVKNLDVLIEAANLLDKEDMDFIVNIVAEPGVKDEKYFEKIKTLAGALEQKGKIKFLGKAPNSQTPAIYNQHKIFVNLTDSGSFDKTILEAMACEILPLVSNRSYEKILPPEFIFKEGDSRDLADKLIRLLAMPESEERIFCQKFRQYAAANHGLDLLAEKIMESFKIM